MCLCRRMPWVVPVVLSAACLVLSKNNIRVRRGFGHCVSFLVVYLPIESKRGYCLGCYHHTELHCPMGLVSASRWLWDQEPLFLLHKIIPLGYSCPMVTVHLATGVNSSKRDTNPPYFFCNTQARAECSIYGNCCNYGTLNSRGAKPPCNET